MLKFCGPFGFGSNLAKVDDSRYSSSRARVVLSALRIMPLFIGLSLLFLFDFNGVAIGSRTGTAWSNPNLSVSESALTGNLISGYASPSWDLTVARGPCGTRQTGLEARS
jgi:hypothetical protein